MQNSQASRCSFFKSLDEGGIPVSPIRIKPIKNLFLIGIKTDLSMAVFFFISATIFDRTYK